MRETLIELKDVAEKFEDLKSKVQFFILRSFLYEYLKLSRKTIASSLAEGEGKEKEEVETVLEEVVVVVVVEEDLVV